MRRPGDDAETLDRVETFRARRRLSPLDRGLLDDVIDHIGAVGSAPGDFVASMFAEHDIVFLGHQYPSQQVARMLADLVPTLHDAGVWTIGLEFACVDDQPLLDALVRAPTFDESLARSALFRWSVRHHFAFREYLDVLREVWRVNQRRDPTAPHHRLVALDYDIDVDAVTASADLRSPFAWPHLRPRGSAARHMAEVVLAEITATAGRGLILTRTPHALTRLRRRPHHQLDRIDVEVQNGRVVGAGNHVYSALADRAATVLVHEPLPSAGEHGDMAYPADGVLDAAFARRNGPKYPVAFEVGAGPLGQLRCTTAQDGADLSAWAHGWIFLDPVDAMTAPTPVTGHVDADTISEARRFTLDAHLRAATSTPADFAAALATAASMTELVWTQIA